MAGVTRWRILRTTISAMAVAIGHLVRQRRQGTVMLKRGDAAPLFDLPGSDGGTYRLAEMRGHTVVLAWFPKAFTGG